MLCRCCGLCSRRNRKINIALGGRAENATKTLKNRILLPIVSTLLSPIVVPSSVPMLRLRPRCFFNKHLLGNSEFCFPRISMFPSTSSRETLRFSGNKIHCSPRDQSLSVYCFPRSTKLRFHSKIPTLIRFRLSCTLKRKKKLMEIRVYNDFFGTVFYASVSTYLH